MKKICSIALLSALLSCHQTPVKQTGYVRIGSLKIYYEKSGKGSPLLFLHAGLMDHSMWDKQVAFFEKSHTVVTIDLPGSGLSTGNDTVTLVADVIRACLDTLQVPVATVIGLSVGAASATEFVLKYPTRVNKLVLASPGANGLDQLLPMDSVSLRSLKTAQAAQASKDIKKIADAFTANWAVGPFRSPGVMDTGVSAYVHAHALHTLQTHLKDSWPNFQKEPPAAMKIAQINKNILLMYGNRDLPFIKACAEYFHRTVKNAQVVVFDHAAHMLNIEQPDKFSAEVQKFLDQ